LINSCRFFSGSADVSQPVTRRAFASASLSSRYSVYRFLGLGSDVHKALSVILIDMWSLVRAHLASGSQNSTRMRVFCVAYVRSITVA
jgi:hypothetical protein